MNRSRSKLFRLTWRSRSFSTTERTQIYHASSSSSGIHAEPLAQPNEPVSSIIGLSTESTFSASSRWSARNTPSPHPRAHRIRQSSAPILSRGTPFLVPPLPQPNLEQAWDGFRMLSAPDEIYSAPLARPQPAHLQQSSVRGLRVSSTPTPIEYVHRPSSKLSRPKPPFRDVEAPSSTAPPSPRPAVLDFDANSDAAAPSLLPLGVTFEQKAGMYCTTIPSTISETDQESEDRWTVRHLVNERRICKLYPARSPQSIRTSRKNKAFRTDGRRMLRGPTPTRAVIAGNLHTRYLAQASGCRSLRDGQRLSPAPISESGTLEPRRQEPANLWRLVTARETLQADLRDQTFQQGPGCRAAIKKVYLPISDNLGNIKETRFKAVDSKVILEDQLFHSRLRDMPLKPSALKDVWNADEEDGHAEWICLDGEIRTNRGAGKLRVSQQRKLNKDVRFNCRRGPTCQSRSVAELWVEENR
jgi:hypothetical protein